VAAGALLAGVIQQPLSDILPERVRTIEAGGVDLLDLDDPGAAAAAHPQNMLRNLAQPQRPSGGAHRPGLGARVVQERLPVFWRQIIVRSQSWPRRHLSADDSGHLFHLLGSRHAPSGWAIGHAELEHNKNTRVEPGSRKKCLAGGGSVGTMVGRSF